jgi:hypothetical protein
LSLTVDSTNNAKDEERRYFLYTSAPVMEDFDFYLRLGDDRSINYHVEVVPAPRLNDATLYLSPPKYTQIDRHAAAGLSADALNGTRVDWELNFENMVQSVTLTRTDGAGKVTEEMLAVSSDGLAAKSTQEHNEVRASFAYSFRWTETVSEQYFEYDQGVEYRVRVVDDRKPQVRISYPPTDGIATPNKLFTVKFSRSDDTDDTAGFSGTWLAYWIGDGTEQRAPVPGLSATTREGVYPRTALRKIIPQVKPGDVLTYAIVVADHYDGKDGPHESWSEKRRLEVVSVEEYSQHVAETLTTIAEELKILQGIEQDATERIDLIRRGAQDKPPAEKKKP